MDLADRYTGALLGLAVGDALGSPYAFLTPFQVQIRHGRKREMTGGGWLHLRPGQYGQNATLAFLLARSLVERGALFEEDVAGRYGDWFRMAPRQPTGVFRTSLALLAEGTPYAEVPGSARDLSAEEFAGNETLVRSAPLALLFGEDRTALVQAAVREARITHWDPDVGGGSAAACLLLSFLLAGATRREAFEGTFDLLEGDETGLPNVLPDAIHMKVADLRTGRHVVDTLEVAIYHFLRAPSFEETLIRVANLGGAADATTPLAGAMAGAFFGAEAIPKRWLAPLVDRTMIVGLAGELLRLRGELDQG